MIKPINGNVLVKPLFHSQAQIDDMKKRLPGFEFAKPKPDEKHTFEGVPNQGYIHALPADYGGDLKVGQRIIFSETSPKGFKHEGEKLLSVRLDQVIATIND